MCGKLKKLRKHNIIRLLFSDALHLTLESVQESGNFRLLGCFLENILCFLVGSATIHANVG